MQLFIDVGLDATQRGRQVRHLTFHHAIILLQVDKKTCAQPSLRIIAPVTDLQGSVLRQATLSNKALIKAKL